MNISDYNRMTLIQNNLSKHEKNLQCYRRIINTNVIRVLLTVYV